MGKSSHRWGGGLNSCKIVGKIQLAHKYADIIKLENLFSAWQEFILGKKQKEDVQVFSRALLDNILALHDDLASNKYCHGGYEDFYVNDPKRRHIHKASVRDRLLHHAIYRILYPFFDKTFISDSFSCRNGKGMHKALDRFKTMFYKVSKNNRRTCWVLKCDIKKFFDSIDHKTLLNILEEHISDCDIMLLLENVVMSFRVSAPRGDEESFGEYKQGTIKYLGKTKYSGSERSLTSATPPEPPLGKRGMIGLPLGNLTSQLFSNIYMNVFDQFVKHKLKVKHYVRYADDFVFLSTDKKYLENLIPEIKKFLSEKLKLTLHPNKIFLQTLSSGVDYLGWKHFLDHRVVRKTTQKRMIKRIKESPTNETLQSYLGLLKHGNGLKVREEMLNEYWLWKE